MNSTTIKITELQSQFDSTIESNPFKNYKNRITNTQELPSPSHACLVRRPAPAAAWPPRHAPGGPHPPPRPGCLLLRGEKESEELEIDEEEEELEMREREVWVVVDGFE
jgi:hypothetical protein